MTPTLQHLLRLVMKSFNVAKAGKGTGAIAVNVTDATKNYLVQLTLDGYSEVSYDILVESCKNNDLEGVSFSYGSRNSTNQTSHEASYLLGYGAFWFV